MKETARKPKRPKRDGVKTIRLVYTADQNEQMLVWGTKVMERLQLNNWSDLVYRLVEHAASGGKG